MAFPDTLSFRLLLTCILLGINLALKLKTFGVPLDFDSSNHLYFAFLRSNKIPFRSSYLFGIKYFSPRMYVPFVNRLRENWGGFRWWNVFSSSCLIIFWVSAPPHMNLQMVFLLLLGILLINSLWVNFATSASEFHEAVILISMLALTNLRPFYLAWVLQCLLLFALVGGFKLANILYVFPLIIFQWEGVKSQALFSLIMLFFMLLPIIWLGRTSFSSARTYSKVRARTLIHIKSILFFKGAPDFIALILLLIAGDIIFGSLAWVVLLLTAMIVFLAQRTYTLYFFYPLVALGVYAGLHITWFEHVPILVAAALPLFTFLLHTCPFIIGKTSIEMDCAMRRKYVDNSGWRSLLLAREVQIAWLRSNIPPRAICYMWGSNVPLLLLAELKSMAGEYYSHNHLLYWAGQAGSPDLFLEKIMDNKPDFILESMQIDNFALPVRVLQNQYQQVYSYEDLTVFQRKSEADR